MTGLLAARSLNPSFPTVFAKGSASGPLFPLAGVGRVGRGLLGPQQEPSFVLKVLLLWGCSPEDRRGEGRLPHPQDEISAGSHPVFLGRDLGKGFFSRWVRQEGWRGWIGPALHQGRWSLAVFSVFWRKLWAAQYVLFPSPARDMRCFFFLALWGSWK